ncbi:hypothetical protein BDV37DRAFT_248536, partial [Aspergillus pseudonomiae]
MRENWWCSGGLCFSGYVEGVMGLVFLRLGPSVLSSCTEVWGYWFIGFCECEWFCYESYMLLLLFSWICRVRFFCTLQLSNVKTRQSPNTEIGVTN